MRFDGMSEIRIMLSLPDFNIVAERDVRVIQIDDILRPNSGGQIKLLSRWHGCLLGCSCSNKFRCSTPSRLSVRSATTRSAAAESASARALINSSICFSDDQSGSEFTPNLAANYRVQTLELLHLKVTYLQNCASAAISSDRVLS
jgi:hypothetical protein